MTATTQTEETKPSGIARLIPMLQWAPQYERSWLRPDLIAGLTVAALVVPKALGYAGIAGVPIQHGLYAAAAGAILYAFFGTCKQIATGPSSALAAVAAGAVIAASASGPDAVTLVATITFVTGILFLLLALFKMGWISQFLSKAVITGFLFGAAIEVVIGELPKLTGTSIEGSNAWQKLFSWLGTLPETDPFTLAVGIASLALILALRFFAPRVPGALVLVVLGIAATAFFNLGELGLALVGDVPRGLPSFALPSLQYILDNLQIIAVASIGLLLIGFSQSAGDAREFASRHRYNIDINQESVAQGISNLGSGLVQGIPVSTSLSASSLNDSAGAKTPVASLTTGVRVILTLLFLAPLFSYLP
jgi:SulP family sulfate permease